MFELWTKDSTDGYKFITLINLYCFKRLFSVVKHDGNGDSSPTKLCQFGGLHYHLNHFNIAPNDLIIIIIDAAIDNPSVKAMFDTISEEISSQNNVFIVPQICFEHNLLGYSNLNNITGCPPQNKHIILQDFLKACGNDLSTFDPNHFTVPLFEYATQFPLKKRTSEHMAKTILSMLCDTPILCAPAKHSQDMYTPALLNGSKALSGVCWYNNCCLPNVIQGKVCNCTMETREQKIIDITNNSPYSSLCKNILDITKVFCRRYYSNHINTTTEHRYKQALLQSGISEFDIFKNIAKRIKTQNIWSYKEIANQKGVVL